MTTYLLWKNKVTAIEWTGGNSSDIQDWVDSLPVLDNMYAQYGAATVSVASTDCTISWSGAGGGSKVVGVGGVFAEGAFDGGALVSIATDHPRHFRVEA